MRRAIDSIVRRLRSGEHLLRDMLNIVESDEKLVRDSQAYWGAPGTDRQRFNAHWRGHGAFVDDERWLEVGRQHLRLYEVMARAVGRGDGPLERIVEWGCGGGANAVHFAPLAREFVGVDIAHASLDECARQLAAAGRTNFVPLLISAADPEAACSRLAGGCDLFLCVYVFETLPSPEYARRVLRIAHRTLASDGMAIIQVKYRTHKMRTGPRRWSYVRNLAHNTTYAIDEFWLEAEACGLRPRLVSLVPKQPLVEDERYAYFALTR